MESISDQKPINVLDEFIVDWIKRNSDESMPFDSFETLRDGNVKQSTVERWIFNCNYLYYRFGNLLYDEGLLCASAEEGDLSSRLLDLLDAEFKTIMDSNPLKLRGHPDQTVIQWFLRDWPPFAKGSRNTLKKLDKAMVALRREFGGGEEGERIEQLAASFEREIGAEASVLAAIAPSGTAAQGLVVARCKKLVPLWCAKEANPLYTLLIWQDETAIAQLVERLGQTFASCGYYSAADEGYYHYDSYVHDVVRAQEVYLDALAASDDELDARAASIPALYRALEDEGFTLERQRPSAALPAQTVALARLIWNVVGCAIFGPRASVGVDDAEQTYTRPRYSFCGEGVDEERDGLRGEVILRRIYPGRGPELAGRLLIEDVRTSCLWKVIGSAYDKNAPLPPSAFHAEYENLQGTFIATRSFDEMGDITEGDGDSRYHAELSVRVDEQGARRLVLVDLGSKNGTYVSRGQGEAVRYYVLTGGREIRLEDWAAWREIDASAAEIVDEVVLKRGDVIRLCGSCFEVL